jgi:alpha-N-acetylglucosamine transferase
MEKNSKNAFVIIHFGNKKKYLELEIYLCLMLKNNSSQDIIYLYSINDTPVEFVNIIKNYCDKTIPYDDKNITYQINNFDSHYKHFNTLRTCNFIFSYKLEQYEKICIIESDMVILKNIDEIFDLDSPATFLYYKSDKFFFDNYKVEINHNEVLNHCNDKGLMNGGIIIIKPSIKLFDLAIEKINSVIKNNCKFPNETLFLLLNKYLYNLPYTYNGIQFYIKSIADTYKLNADKYLSIVHFNSNEYKHIDIIRDKWLDKIKKKKRHLYYPLYYFNEKYYLKYNKNITKLLENL